MIKDKILEFLTTKEVVTSTELEMIYNTTSDKIYPEIISLQSNDYIEFEIIKTAQIVLTKEG